MLAPWVGLIALVLSYAFAPFHQLSLGVTIALVLLPIISAFASQPLGITEPAPVIVGFFAILLIAMFRRLTAAKTALSASVSRGELILNRLLFDRDIRDRKAWISQTRTEAGSTD
jgi:glycerol-3-phosphate acyltransferase PlsY